MFFKYFIYGHAILWVSVSMKPIKQNLINLHEMIKTRPAAVKIPVTFQTQGDFAEFKLTASLLFSSLV
jgi:hypothetical protein